MRRLSDIKIAGVGGDKFSRRLRDYHKTRRICFADHIVLIAFLYLSISQVGWYGERWSNTIFIRLAPARP